MALTLSVIVCWQAHVKAHVKRALISMILLRVLIDIPAARSVAPTKPVRKLLS